MSVEAPSPIDEARSAFNDALMDPEVTGPILLTKTLQLQNVLVGSDLEPDKIYHELFLASSQAARKAKLKEDADTELALMELRKGFQLTHENFKPKVEPTPTPTTPTRTSSLPAMTGAKGAEARTQPKVAPKTKENEPGEETVNSFLRQKRIQLKWTQARLGKEAGNIQAALISHFEGHGVGLNAEKVKQLAAVLNLDEEGQKKFQELFDKKFGQTS